mmetsp:Transcript_30154/g.36854  ORF Transcript_30154/g.36854 Transcript_30154/m.36854 type:complete len:171 (+) Transcript_30154:138-650(+)|eukprot:CAMPEP_0172482772 /NCGR_PEP_ID=MMETSP1066-20121228/9379_1 /TAXON_ID=671091 /ORGANISM="Coscinodiscus wailesii, Strain CCMP2513" /LENGTH=170 /DNA_ID=CAMNT_0013246175 /DNA_START=130 /DNA_END=642 /DNA_ORIENTATION=+
MNHSNDKENEEVLIIGTNRANHDDREFDQIVGALESILMNEDFLKLQNSLCSSFSPYFDDSDENKLIHTELFMKYTQALETFIEKKVSEQFKGISMDTIASMLIGRMEEMEGTDVLDMLMSFTDFNEFKRLILSYKTECRLECLTTSAVEIAPVPPLGVRRLCDPSSSRN